MKTLALRLALFLCLLGAVLVFSQPRVARRALGISRQLAVPFLVKKEEYALPSASVWKVSEPSIAGASAGSISGAGSLDAAPVAAPAVASRSVAPPLADATDKATSSIAVRQGVVDTSAFLATLPSLGELRALTDESAHQTPKLILAAGAQIGSLIERANAESALRPKALQTLVACAEDSRVAVVVRALCLSGATRYSLQWRVFVALADVQADDEIRSLAASDVASTAATDFSGPAGGSNK
jgi:hypothetical protein